jgi:F-type H+-transporting ATPase subunit b
MEAAGIFAESRTWVIIAFLIFFALFGRKLWQAIVGMLDKRSEAVRAELAEASRLRHEAEAMLEDARARREQALEDARRLLQGAQAEAARLAEAAAREAQASAARRERMALDRIAAAEKAAVSSVRLAATDIAMIAAEQVIRDELGPEADAPLVDSAIAGLPAALARKAA